VIKSSRSFYENIRILDSLSWIPYNEKYWNIEGVFEIVNKKYEVVAIKLLYNL
ncbi:2850_t:CDS:1, partial [Racocetra fulgida]